MTGNKTRQKKIKTFMYKNKYASFVQVNTDGFSLEFPLFYKKKTFSLGRVYLSSIHR